MKANELRLGNYLTDRIHRTILVSEIRPEHLVFYLGNRTKMKHHINTFSPIPLTEKWLLDFGFEKWTWCDDCAFIPLFFGDILYCRYYNNLWHVKRMKIGRDSKGVFGKSEGKYLLPKDKIKYVHQLQNLYFALTNKELTIK